MSSLRPNWSQIGQLSSTTRSSARCRLEGRTCACTCCALWNYLPQIASARHGGWPRRRYRQFNLDLRLGSRPGSSTPARPAFEYGAAGGFNGYYYGLHKRRRPRACASWPARLPAAAAVENPRQVIGLSLRHADGFMGLFARYHTSRAAAPSPTAHWCGGRDNRARSSSRHGQHRWPRRTVHAGDVLDAGAGNAVNQPATRPDRRIAGTQRAHQYVSASRNGRHRIRGRYATVSCRTRPDDPSRRMERALVTHQLPRPLRCRRCPHPGRPTSWAAANLLARRPERMHARCAPGELAAWSHGLPMSHLLSAPAEPGSAWLCPCIVLLLGLLGLVSLGVER